MADISDGLHYDAPRLMHHHILLFSMFAAALCSSAGSLPSADALLEKHFKAIGGKSAVLRDEPVRVHGFLRISALNAEAPIEYLIQDSRRFKAVVRYHHKFFGRLKVPLVGKFSVACGADEEGGWGIDQQEQPFLIEGANRVPFHALFEKFTPLCQEPLHASSEVLDEITWETKTAFRVLKLTHDGSHYLEFFDSKTGLALGSEHLYQSERGAVTARFVYHDYRTMAGRLFPSRIQIRVSDESWDLRVTSVDHLKIKSSDVAVPGSVAKLRRKRSEDPQNLSTENLPSPQSILLRHAGAVGGVDAFNQIRSVRLSGQYNSPRDQLEGSWELLRRPPVKSLLKVDIKNWGIYEAGCDGNECWRIRKKEEVTLFDGLRKAQEWDRADFLHDLHLPEKFKFLKTLAKVEFNGAPCHKLLLVRHSGEVVTHYYGVSDGLLSGVVTIFDSPDELSTEILCLSDYRNFGGILFPVRRLYQNKDYHQEMILQNVTFDPIPEAAFEMPVEVKKRQSTGRTGRSQV